MKVKQLSIIALSMLMGFHGADIIHADSRIQVKINNITRNYDQSPTLEGSRVFVPIRGISEDTGATVQYIENEKKVSINKDGTTISFVIGSTSAEVNGEIKEIPESFITGSRTMLPLRFINEMLGYQVEWLHASKIVSITTDRGSVVQQLLGAAEKYLGTPYKYGGEYLRDKAFDCSSFTQAVFSDAGYSLPRTSTSQSRLGTLVSIEEAQPGDLVFFDTTGNKTPTTVSHVAILIDENTLLQATTSLGVSYTAYSKYWKDRTLFIKNYLQIP